MLSLSLQSAGDTGRARSGRLAATMARDRSPRGTVRVNAMLSLTHAERRAFEAPCASELRTSEQMVTRIVVRHLATRGGNPFALSR